MAEKQARAAEPLRVVARAYYAAMVKEHLMEQPPTFLVVQGADVIGEFDTESHAVAYCTSSTAVTPTTPAEESS
jgi:hypothetical protein